MGELWPVPGWSSFFNLLTLTSSGLIQHNDSMDRLIPRGFLGSDTSTQQMSKYPNILESQRDREKMLSIEGWRRGGGCDRCAEEDVPCHYDTIQVPCVWRMSSKYNWIFSQWGRSDNCRVFYSSPTPSLSPRTQHPIISKSRGIFANLILIFQIFLLTNEQGLRHLVSINTLTSTHITSARQINPKIMFLSTTYLLVWSSQWEFER